MSKLEIKLKEKKRFIYYNGKKTHYKISSLGKIYNVDTNTEKQINSPNYEYKMAHLIDHKCKLDKMIPVHRLVAKAFIPNPKNKPFVNHIDGNKRNNCLYNLEWVTASENTLHAIRTGLKKIGEDGGNALYKNSQIEDVCKYLEEGKLQLKDISKKTGVSIATISMVKSGKVRKHQSNKYKIKSVKFEDQYGDNHPRAILNSSQVHEICQALQDGSMMRLELAKKYNVKPCVIDNIRRGKTWKSISKDYHWKY